jgi:hypothetical protein
MVPAMDPRLVPLLSDQDGVLSRRQAHEAGLAPHDLARLVRRNELTRLHPGVFVDHTGTPSFLQRAWGGVLLYWPAALAGPTALRAAEGPGSDRSERTIHLAVGRHRHLAPPSGITVRRMTDFEERVQWNLGPPRLRYEQAVLDVAAEARSDFAALAELSRAVQGRRTTAGRLAGALDSRARMGRRDWMRSVLADIAAGTCSVLEHGYLTRVERAHGLAPGRRQVRDRVGPGVVYRDVLYRCDLVVELDGRLFHDSTEKRDRDLDRDLDAADATLRTVRLAGGHVFDRPCWTAVRLIRIMRTLGDPGRPVSCGVPSCQVGPVAA